MTTIQPPTLTILRGFVSGTSFASRIQIKEYAPTFATEFAVIASQLVVYKLASHYLGAQGFSEYAVARRFISTIYPICLLGLGVGLPRYLAISKTRNAHGQHRDCFFGAALWCVGIATAVLLALINLEALGFSYLIYGNEHYAFLAVPLSLIIAGLSLHAMTYSYFRGRLLMMRANVLQFTNLAVVPLLAFSWPVDGVATILMRVGILSICVSGVGLMFTPWQRLSENSSAEAKLLLRYSLPRVPGDFALMGLLGLPAFVVAHQAGVREAGYVAFGISILSMIGAAFAPVGLVLLPKSSQMFASGAIPALQAHVRSLVWVGLLLSGCLSLLVFLSAGPFIRRYLGPEYAEVAQVARLLCLGAIPYSIFLILRNVLDAFHHLAITSFTLIGALFVAVAGSTVGLMVHGGWKLNIYSLLAALTLLGAIAGLEARRIFKNLMASR